MLSEHLASGRPVSTVSLGASLSEFVPMSVRGAPEGPGSRDQERWEKELRPQIFAAMESFLIDGGYEERLRLQSSLFEDLSDAGIRIAHLPFLQDVVAASGDWRKEFSLWVEQGSQRGVKFVAGVQFDGEKASQALLRAGFSPEQVVVFRANVG